LSQRFDDVESCYESTGWCVSHLTLDVFIMLPVPLCNLGCTNTTEGTWMLYKWNISLGVLMGWWWQY